MPRKSQAGRVSTPTAAQAAASRARIERSIPAMIEGQRRARERREAEARARATPKPASCFAIELYRAEKAAQAERTKPLLLAAKASFETLMADWHGARAKGKPARLKSLPSSRGTREA